MADFILTFHVPGQLAEQKVKTVLIVWAMDPVNEAHTVFVEKLAKYLKVSISSSEENCCSGWQKFSLQ